MKAWVVLQDVADSVDLSSHEDSQAEVQASLQVGADARQLIMEAVMHLQVCRSSIFRDVTNSSVTSLLWLSLLSMSLPKPMLCQALGCLMPIQGKNMLSNEAPTATYRLIPCSALLSFSPMH